MSRGNALQDRREKDPVERYKEMPQEGKSRGGRREGEGRRGRGELVRGPGGGDGREARSALGGRRTGRGASGGDGGLVTTACESCDSQILSHNTRLATKGVL